jgi:hypothetical protein
MLVMDERELAKQRRAAVLQRREAQCGTRREATGMLVGVAPTREDVDPALVHSRCDRQGRP